MMAASLEWLIGRATQARTRALHGLIRRSVSGAVIVIVALGALWIGGWLLGVMIAVLAAGAAAEFFGLAARRDIAAFRLLGCGGAAALVLAATLRPTLTLAAPLLWTLTLALLLAAGVGAVWRRSSEQQPFAVIGVTVAAALWSGGTLAFLILLRELGAAALPATALAGPALALWPLTLTWTSDSMAFLVGSTWGRHRLSPRISPNKTWEGAIAGGVVALAVGGAYAALVLDGWLGLPVSWRWGLGGGAIVALVGPLGDAAKSLLKREAGVKDAGRIFPGHGGIIDRFDTLMYALPLIYWLARVALPDTAMQG